MKEHSILIIGGGLAGLCAAVHLAMEGLDVAILEKQTYPHHKVCGEYVSKEVEPYLQRLGIDLRAKGAIEITRFSMSAIDGYSIETELPLGGFGISRYAFDNYLYLRAKELGVIFYFEKVISTAFKDDQFTVVTNVKNYTAKIVIGAYGKRSVLDKKLDRNFSRKKHSWLAVKAHYKVSDFPKGLVALHNFKGGYGGLSQTETGALNFCYLAHYNSFKACKDVDSYTQEIVGENPSLRKFLENSEPVFDNPMTIAQISFDKKDSVVDHMLMCGDTAGLIHPLCGNGMAMAIHSAKIASELIVQFYRQGKYSRVALEQDYRKAWSKNFARRLWFGRILQGILLNEKWVSIVLKTIGRSKTVLRYIISKTHGKPIV